MAESIENLQAYADIARAKKLYETNTDPALRKKASELAAAARKRLGDSNFGSNLNADDFASKYGVSTAWDFTVSDGKVTQHDYSDNKKSSRTIYDKGTSSPTSSSPRVSQYNPQDYVNQMRDYVNKMYNDQQSAQLAQLKAQREKATGALNQQKTNLKPQYQGMRNQADIGYNQNVQRLREAMANAGLTASGENVSAMTGLMGARQGALNDLNLQQQQATNDIDRRITDLNNPNDVLALTGAINAERNRALLDAYQNAVGRQDQLGQQAIQNQLAQAGLTGYLNGTPTMALNNQLFDQNMAQNKFEYGQQQDAINNAFRQQQIEQSARQFAQQMGYNYDRLSQDQKQFYDNLAQRQAELQSSGTPQLDDKESTDNYYNAIDQLSNAQDRTEALQYIQSIKSYLTDSDYAKLMNYISEKFYE